MADSSFLRSLHARFATRGEEVRSVVERVVGRTPMSMDRVVNGYDNEVYRVGLDGAREVFVRIRRQGEGEFNDEAWAMRRAAAVGVPVPEMLGIDRVSTDDGERSVMLLASAPRRALETIDTLSDADRLVVMVSLGQLLKRLRSVRMPGMWRPGADGTWPTPDELRRYYIRDRLAERPELEQAGLTAAEIDLTFHTLQFFSGDADGGPVLCHGDLNPGHVFIGDNLRVSCLIDWGMWHAGSQLGELAYIWKTFGDEGLVGTLSGLGGGSMTDPAFRRLIAESLAQQQIGHIAHHVRIGDTEGVTRNVGYLRRALSYL